MLDLFRPKIVRIYGPTAAPGVSAKDQAKKEKLRVYWQEYHQKRRAARLQAMRDRYAANKAEYIERAYKWQAANPEKFRAIKLRSAALNRNKRLRLTAAP